VRAFRNAGAQLVLVDRAPDRLPRLFPELAATADHLLVTSVDLVDAQAVEGAVRRAIERFGRIDVLANTVGGYRGGTFLHETPVETLDFLLSLNARTVFNVCHAVIPHMLEQGSGRIISVAARAALRGGSRMSAYSAAKSAVVRLTEALAAETRRKGVNVNCVLPGTIDTPQNRRDMPDANHGRWVQPAAIADVILFLASDAARDVHGASIPVYGRS
jgi:NAD(P)-dependent dehydrogenase (short-subunit alcohol dehydrogenase family)